MRKILSKFVILMCLFYCVISDSENKFFLPAGEDNIDFESNEDILKHERYARHVQVITESVVDHIVKELKTKFPEVRKRLSKGRLNQIAEDLNTMVRILKLKRMRTVNRMIAKNTTKRSPIFWKNKYMFNNNT